MTEHDLESLYREAQSALKAKDYDRASNLLRQILLVDENYRDASRLLAQSVKLKRRRWYNDPRFWGVLGLVIIVALGFFIAPRIRGFYTVQPSTLVTDSPTTTLPPTVIVTQTEALLPTPTAVPLTWKRISLGQNFERDTVTAFVIDPKDHDVLYSGMKNAGIYKSIDGGLSWRPAHYGLTNTHVVSLLIDSQNARILYAGTLEGIYKTEDGAESWSKIGTGIYLLMDPQNNSHLFARDENGIYESIDQGKNWRDVYSTKEGCPDRIQSWAIHPIDGKTLFIGGGGECDLGIYLSNDGGNTWVPEEMGNYCLDGLVIGLDGQGNYHINTSCFDYSGFTPPPTFDSVYTYMDSRLFKENLNDGQRLILGKPDVGFVTAIAISPVDPDTIYVGGEGLSVSRDAGLTWTKLNNGLGNTMLYLGAGLGNASTLYLLSGGCKEIQIQSGEGGYTTIQAFYVSNNGGITWEAIPQTGCHLIKDADELTLYRMGESYYRQSGGAWHGIIWRSQDGGRSWQRVLTPNYIQTIVAHASQTGLLYGFTHDPYYQSRVNPNFQEEDYFYSNDHGHTWNKQGPPVSTKPCYGSTLQFIDKYRPMAIDPFDGNHVFVIDNGTLLESHNSCDTTETFATSPNRSMNSIAFDPDNPDILYVGTDSGAYISFDGGNTWNQINDGLLGATVIYSIVVDKDSNVYAATPYGIFKLEGK